MLKLSDSQTGLLVETHRNGGSLAVPVTYRPARILTELALGGFQTDETAKSRFVLSDAGAERAREEGTRPAAPPSRRKAVDRNLKNQMVTRARAWRAENTEMVAGLLSGARHGYPPCGQDRQKPETWTGAHWAWLDRQP